MNLQAINSRLFEEVKTLSSLLKMKIRVEAGPKDNYSKLTLCIDKLLQIEEKASNALRYTSDLEKEVQMLRKTCEKYSELSESVQLINSKYKLQISQLSSEKALLQNELSNIRFILIYPS